MRDHLSTEAKDSVGLRATSADAVDAIVEISNRRSTFPLRRSFIQSGQGPSARPGPLAHLVSAGDRRSLVLYLLLRTKASAPPWNTALPAAAWARALGHDLPESKSARSAVSRCWQRLDALKLVRRDRRDRMADVYLLKEDGSGDPYSELGSSREPYIQIPLALWTDGPSEEARWYQVLTLPELTVLMIGLSLGDQFWIPFDQASKWYGVSADTLSRGVNGLASRELLLVEEQHKLAPLSKTGLTVDRRYTLKNPFGPVGRISGSVETSRRLAKRSLSDPNPNATRSEARSSGGAATKRVSARAANQRSAKTR